MSKDLTQLRKEAHLSRFQLAQKLEVTPGSIYNWEKGIREPSANAIYRMAKVFQTSTDAIFLALHTTKVVNQKLKNYIRAN
ncbi:helix-turn-helix transcriptional regulator [Limosilactobacillus frumenti]|uniref:helix-turn-helix transcriptional regulator n=1 Tax=Limosilactobacillus frumenti TaxID=104955 RepID=UPI0007102ACB|nr:helix-turn-helix transcriptional regulator [Limosilactobacillus frumenti]